MEKGKSIKVEQETSWFKEHEQELIEKAKEKKKIEETDALKKAHYMHCPKCGHMLCEFMIEHISLDKCEGCEGIWLDRGKLDGLMKHSEKKKNNFFTQLFSHS
ncbi:hypothetical protein AUJ95_07760 [Candidatus Desantisbacteria bacterium CG2_30_40_21]|uniref:Transcription factor zinc-finger domain-containing protein n=5 Tax=unclassified Candidatus Desantisiibacteriota TaxID=3106372 RepID=A0A2M7JE16_9BACT|nr:MAG: hypothetical protein AUJ95_07760 [Candidatus Desantisbacteria bacterium CG2_30_40_21]PIP42214.1 MAG: hypothetical protein COX18_01065 [Candidatus Desantisbacteria bacterium CG23_combo_of_CG06-09_8_20_14_all_40_23]PIX17606.1 MAG: hypothetical protein COZ71_02345 [Candidatus Desantisbacteria bacterium CG_4_8_14_3_um_filter_40_12]PIY19184.1 MAG: hypothetical protein COZ13_06740 [Candidatus Desantisbacteria bacterium CG_4_10_14_3_um_filter_40_18]PJB30450.1 MAG: hypothetical protein CO110_00